MRARNLKPGFFKNEVLASLPPLCRILYEGCWCLSDRDGRFEDRPLRIKAEVLPYDDCDVEAFLVLLVEKGFIKRYSVNGSNYIEIPSFLKHQRPNIKEQESLIPAHKKHKRTHNGHQMDTVSNCSPSPFPLPESPLPLYRERFDIFWKAYPKKLQRPYTLKIWMKLKPSEELLNKMIKTIETFKETEQWKKERGQFIPYPSTWLNQGRWEDEVGVERKSKWDS